MANVSTSSSALPSTLSYLLSAKFQLQVDQAACLLDLVAYVEHPGCFLICKTCKIVIPLDLIPFYFSRTKHHVYNRNDCAQLLAA
jgi:hypothetical protein